MSYNKAELAAIQMIANKLNWQMPVWETLETINQMVRNQQALELDTVGECDDFEETLLSLALWNKDKIVSTQYVCDYESMVMWNVQSFCEDMGITPADYANMVTYYNCIQPEIFDIKDEVTKADEEYWQMCYNDYNYAVYMGWI